MFFVLCPFCGSRMEVPSDSVGTERQHLWNVVVCESCDASFDYDDEDIQTADDHPAESAS